MHIYIFKILLVELYVYNKVNTIFYVLKKKNLKKTFRKTYYYDHVLGAYINRINNMFINLAYKNILR